MTKQQKHTLLARRMRNNAARILKRGRKDWKGDAEMLAVVEQDYKDHMEIAKLLRTGKLQKAASWMHDLDTNSREDVPQTVYDYLDQF